MKESKKSIGGIVQLQDVLEFSDSELAARAKLYLEKCANKFYKGDIVFHSGYGKSRQGGYKTKEGRPFGEVITEVLLDSDLVIPPDEQCTYNGVDERKNATIKRNESCETFSKMRTYCEDGNSETKLMHVLAMLKDIGDFEVVDYQTPTTNGSKDNIDILLKRDGILYMTEAKRFGSSEQLVRCVLEIQTYYCKLNHRFFEIYHCTRESLKKAVLFDESSFAYQQLCYPWAKQLLSKFDITVLVLSKEENGYSITEKTL